MQLYCDYFEHCSIKNFELNYYNTSNMEKGTVVIKFKNKSTIEFTDDEIIKGIQGYFRIKIHASSTEYDIGLVRATIIDIMQRRAIHPFETDTNNFKLASDIAKVLGNTPIIAKGFYNTVGCNDTCY